MVLREVPVEISADDRDLYESLYTHTPLSSTQCFRPSAASNYSRSPPDGSVKYDCDIELFDADKVEKIIAAMITEEKKEAFPVDDQDIVRYLIGKQGFDGLWNLDSKEIKQLAGKPLSHFQQSTNTQLLISAIVVAVLETRFTSFSSMWYGVVQKARTRFLDFLANDKKRLNKLLDDIRKQL